jgi:hypothetical protein
MPDFPKRLKDLEENGIIGVCIVGGRATGMVFMLNLSAK